MGWCASLWRGIWQFFTFVELFFCSYFIVKTEALLVDAVYVYVLYILRRGRFIDGVGLLGFIHFFAPVREMPRLLTYVPSLLAVVIL